MNDNAIQIRKSTKQLTSCVFLLGRAGVGKFRCVKIYHQESKVSGIVKLCTVLLCGQFFFFCLVVVFCFVLFFREQFKIRRIEIHSVGMDGHSRFQSISLQILVPFCLILCPLEESAFCLRLQNPSFNVTFKSLCVPGILSCCLAQAPVSLLSLAFSSGGFLEYPKASVQLSLGEWLLTSNKNLGPRASDCNDGSQ